MSLGLPAHLASRVVTAAISRAGHVLAGLMLASAVLASLLLIGSNPPRGIVLLVTVSVAIAVLLVFLSRRPSLVTAGIYLVFGAAGLSAATVVAAVMPSRLESVDAYVIAALWIALVLTGAAGGGYRRGIVMSVAGLVAGAVGAAVGAAVGGVLPPVEPTVPFAALLIVTIYFVTGTSTRYARRAQPDIHRAARDEKLAEVRIGVEARAAALLHDTVLGSLAAVASSPVGPLPRKVADSLESDLHAIIGQDWSERPIVSEDVSHAAPITAASEQAAALGLHVETTGDLGALARVDPSVVETVALAVRQLLANVRLHSGSPTAEVVVFGDDRTVSVMVIDSGEGFDPEAVSADRLGLRNSVKRRLSLVNGEVKIWSSPGRGTSVLLSVPVSDSASPPDESASSARQPQGAM